MEKSNAAMNLAKMMEMQNNSILENMVAEMKHDLRPRSCGLVQQDWQGNDWFVIYDESGNVIGKSRIYPGESMNGWTV